MRKSLVSIIALGLFAAAPAMAESTEATKNTEATNQSTTMSQQQQQTTTLDAEQIQELLSEFDERSEVEGSIARAMTSEGNQVLVLVGPENLEADGSVEAEDSDIRDRFQEGGFTSVEILDDARIARANFDDDHYIFALSADQIMRFGIQTGETDAGMDRDQSALTGTDTDTTTQMGQTDTQSGTMGQDDTQLGQSGTQSGTMSQDDTQLGQTDTQSGTMGQDNTQLGQTDTQSGTLGQDNTQLGQTDTQSGTMGQDSTQLGQSGTQSGTMSQDDTQLGQTDTQSGTMGQDNTQLGQTDTQSGTMGQDNTQLGQTNTETGQAARALSEPDADRIVSNLEEAGFEDASEFQGQLFRALSEDGAPVFFLITSRDMESDAEIDISEDDVREKLEEADVRDVQSIDDLRIVRGSLEDDHVFVLAGDLTRLAQ